jgi:type I restriction enzyme M protein
MVIRDDDYFLPDCTARLLQVELKDRDYYREVNVFWVSEAARWEALRAAAKQPERRQAGRRGHLRPRSQPHHLALGGDEPGHSRHRFNLGCEPADTFTRNQFPDLHADFILANPPFNISDWWHASLMGDARWHYGDPPQGNANYAWLQHMLHHLKPGGRAGIVLANGSMSSSQNNEGQIRAAMVDADVVEVMIALPGQLFFNTQIPACLWFLTKGKRKRPSEVLFIDTRKRAVMISRVQCEITDEVIDRIAAAVAGWRGDAGTDGYANVAGYCRSVTLTEIAEHGHVLTPERYVGAEAVADDDEGFEAKMQALTEKLGEQMAKEAELDLLIRQKLGGLGYEF